ncbi:MAG: hypothetical protein H0U49_09660, partial [Parachlamydiaceae bacterium]|nr:hypothetical protein [Parachlamydiaceae bacterium]
HTFAVPSKIIKQEIKDATRMSPKKSQLLRTMMVGCGVFFTGLLVKEICRQFLVSSPTVLTLGLISAAMPFLCLDIVVEQEKAKVKLELEKQKQMTAKA